MRKIVMFNRVSADGYFASAAGGLDWAVPEPELDQQAMSGPPRFDLILFGRVTYQMFASFWPYALDGSTPAQDPHGARRSPELRAMAIMLNETAKLVYSRTLTEVSWKGTRLEPRLDPGAIESLKQGP